MCDYTYKKINNLSELFISFSQIELTQTIFVHLPVHLLIDFEVVFNWHGGRGDQFSTESINGCNLSNSKHHQLLILGHAKMQSEVIRLVKKLDSDSGRAADTLKCFMLITQV